MSLADIAHVLSEVESLLWLTHRDSAGPVTMTRADFERLVEVVEALREKLRKEGYP